MSIQAFLVHAVAARFHSDDDESSKCTKKASILRNSLFISTPGAKKIKGASVGSLMSTRHQIVEFGEDLVPIFNIFLAESLLAVC